MKKFLIAVIFVIPIVVVLALSVTGKIIEVTTPPNPTGIEIRNSSNVVLDKGDIVKVDIRDTDEFIIINVFPQITPDKSVTYERDDEAGDGLVELERIGTSTRYKLLPRKMGVTKLEIRTRANRDVYTTVTFQITADTIERITLYNGEGTTIEEKYAITGKERIYYDIYPIDALSNNEAVWSTENSAVVTVGRNGTLTPVARGYGGIRVTAKDKDGNTKWTEITVDTTAAVAKTYRVYVTEDVTLTPDWIKANVAVSPNDTEVEYMGKSEGDFIFRMTSNIKSEQVSVEVRAQVCSATEWGFLDNLDTIYTANGPYFTWIGLLTSGEEIQDGVIYESSDPNVMEVTPFGELIPIKAGRVNLIARYGGEERSKEIIIRERPVAFELDLQSADGKLGIQMSRKWGNLWFERDENGEYVLDYWNNLVLTNVFNFGIPEPDHAFDLYWTATTGANGEELVSIEPLDACAQRVNLTFLPACFGKSVTVTATLLVNKRPIQNVRRSFTFNMIDKEELGGEGAINVYGWREFREATEWWHRDLYHIVMQDDSIYDQPDNRHNIWFPGSIFGNGFTFDYSSLKPEKAGEELFLLDLAWIPIGGKQTFENLVIKGAPTLEAANNTATFACTSDRGMPISFRFCQVYNTTCGIRIHGSKEVLVEGCILGDNYNCSLDLGYHHIEDEIDGVQYDSSSGKLTLKNNVFKQTKGPSIIIRPRAINESNSNKNVMPTINIEGFMDVYNWVERDNVKDSFTTAFLALVGETYLSGNLRDVISKSLADIVEQVVNVPENDGLFYSYNGTEYASLAMFAMGLMCDVDPELIHMDEGLNKQGLIMKFRDSKGKPIGGMEGVEQLIKLIINVPGMTFTNDAYILSEDFSGNTEPNIKPGEPVPNDKELYLRLVGGTK